MSGFCMHMQGVTCANCRRYYHPYEHIVPVVPQPRIIEGQKCEICGSTAIDHTEMNCQINRMGKPPKPKSPKEGEE